MFKKDNYGDNYSLRYYILTHIHVIQSPIANYSIKVKLDDWNGGAMDELSNKLIPQVFVHKLHIDMIKNILLGFQCHIMKKDL